MTLRVAVTQDVEAGAHLAARLREAGLAPVLLPQIAFEATGEGASGSSFDLLVATSPRALTFLASAPGGLPAVTRVWTVGATTARAAEKLGLPVDPAVQPGNGAALGAVLPTAPPVLRVLLPRGALARDEVIDAARAKGHEVEAPVVYNTVPVAYDPSRVAAVRREPPEVLLFTSPSTFRHFVAAFGVEVVAAARAIGVLGDTTRAEVEGGGFLVTLQPSRPDLALLVEEVKRFRERLPIP
jgi:uroporphyrinogen-III synthase